MSAPIEYPVFYNRALAEARRSAAKKNLIGRIVSLVFSGIISGLIWWFLRDQLGSFAWLLALGFLLPLGYLVHAIVNLRRAGRDLAAVHDGLALGLGRDGLLVEQSWLPWSEVGRVEARPRPGRSDRLVVAPREGDPLDVPLDFLTVMPATLDSGIRALSGGRRHLDFTALDL